MFDVLGCAGVARLDFFLTEDGPVLNEINTMPGMTAESQVPRMFAAAGVPYADLIIRLVASATIPGSRAAADVSMTAAVDSGSVRAESVTASERRGAPSPIRAGR